VFNTAFARSLQKVLLSYYYNYCQLPISAAAVFQSQSFDLI